MLNKKLVGFAVGAMVGVAAVAGVAVAYYYCKVKKLVRCDKCEIGDECECCGKYAHVCLGDCLVEECPKFRESDFDR